MNAGIDKNHKVDVNQHRDVVNTSVNPARSTGVAVFVGDWAVAQLWLFWVAPIVGAVIGAAIYRFVGGNEN